MRGMRGAVALVAVVLAQEVVRAQEPTAERRVAQGNGGCSPHLDIYQLQLGLDENIFG